MAEEKLYDEKIIEISRVSRTVKGGKRISFRALVIVGDKNGKVGMGLGKANDVSIAIRKAADQAKKRMVKIDLTEEGSIKKEIVIHLNSAKILMKKAPEGTSIIAGGVVRSVCELSGVRNMVSKSYGSNNKINIARATIEGLKRSSVGA